MQEKPKDFIDKVGLFFFVFLAVTWSITLVMHHSWLPKT